MHNLVLELDNNLSFGTSRESSSNSSRDNATAAAAAAAGLMGPLKTIQMDASGLQFHDKNVIGRGTYATVYKCQLHGTDIAVKLFDSQLLHPHITPEVSSGFRS